MDVEGRNTHGVVHRKSFLLEDSRHFSKFAFLTASWRKSISFLKFFRVEWGRGFEMGMAPFGQGVFWG